MAMTSEEIVRAALKNEGPDRLPVCMHSLGVSDIHNISMSGNTNTVKNGQRFDEWDCGWDQTELENMGQVTVHPLSDVNQFERIQVPVYTQDSRYETVDEQLRQAEARGMYTQTGIFMILFERMHSLAGFESVLMGLLDDPESSAAMADKILDAHISIVRQFQNRFGKRLHSFSMTDDWGTQKAAFISKELWDDFFLPRYRKLFDVMHEGGQDVWLHSCGKVNELVEGFIEAGVDAVNLQQPRALGIAEMGERYGGRIAFSSLADIQVTLPSGDHARITEDAQMLGKHWMTKKGGFVLSDYGDGVAIGASAEAKRIMYQAFSDVSEDVYGQPLPTVPQAVLQ